MIALTLLLSSLTAQAQIRVGVIDTGIDAHDPRFSEIMCKDVESKDFTGAGINDYYGHGTFVVGLIKEYAGDASYCIVMYKFVHTGESPSPLLTLSEAIMTALSDHVDVINISAGGPGFYIDEYKAFKAHPEVTVFAAAGNFGQDISKYPYFPASYPLSSIIAVGNGLDKNNRAYNSNYGGRVKTWVNGQDIVSDSPLWRCSIHDRHKGAGCKTIMSGTSMSTAIATGKWVRGTAKGRIAK